MQKTTLTFILIFFCNLFCIAQSPNIDSLLAIVAEKREDTGKVIAYRMLAGLMANSIPAKAIVYAGAGIGLGKKIGFEKGVAGCYINLTFAYSAAGKIDSAMVYSDTAVIWALKVAEPGRIALAYQNRADYNRQLGNMKKALVDCDTSMKYAEIANKDDTRARVYQTMGSIYHAQENYAQARLNYEKAYMLYEKVGNKKMMAISMNNLGNAYKRLDQMEIAEASYQNAIRLGKEIGDENSLAMYYANLSDVYTKNNNLPMAEASALKSLELAKKQESELQILTAQLSLADIWLKMNKIPASIQAATEAYTIAIHNQIFDEAQSAAEILSDGYSKVNNYQEAYRFSELSKSLNDSLAKQKFNDDVTAMQTKFNVNEKDKEIALLAKDKELQLQKLRQQWLMVIGTAAIALLLLIGAWLLLNRNKLKQRMKELEIRNQIAADLHDEVGSSLSSIHMLSQLATQGNESTQKDILERMSSNAKETMDKMGDIVWMIKAGETEAGSLKQRMERFAYEICISKNIELQMKVTDLENAKLSMEQRKNIYLVFKEAVNNAVKYSGATRIEVSTFFQNNILLLKVQDFGNGFDTAQTNGNGLGNMRQRAVDLRAEIKIESAINKGTLIELAVPV